MDSLAKFSIGYKQVRQYYMKNIESILKEYKISIEGFKGLSHKMRPLNLKKGDIFIEAGKKNDKIGILLNGLLIATYISEKGKEEVSRFYSPEKNFIISNHESFHYDKVSGETISAFSESQIFYMTKNDLYSIYRDFPEFEKIARELAEESYINALNRIHDLQSLSGKERVEKFIKENRNLLNIVNKQHIASYLGINRNDFSKYLSKL